MNCPKCGGTQVRVVSEVRTTTENEGYDVCQGLCCGSVGAALLGPVGWLFALCGIGKDRTTTTKKELWACENCGNRWR